MQALDLPNLRDTPFRLGVDPADAVAHCSWREARDAVLAELAGGGSARVALLGPAGSGKTLLLHALAGTLRDQGRAVRVADRGGTPAELGGGGVLLLDDADRLDGSTLASLGGRDGPCVLAGPPTLAGRLPASFAAITLAPLPPDEIARFVAARLAAAGQRRDLLEPDAVLALARLSGGVPRQVNALAGAAVFLAGLDGAATVGPRHVEEAAAMRDGGETGADPAPAPVDPTPVNVQTPPAQAPSSRRAPPPPRIVAEPPAPRPAVRTKPAMVIGAGLLALLVIVGVVVSHPWTGARLREQVVGVVPPQSPRPSPSRQPEAAPPPQPPPGNSSPAPVREPAPAPAMETPRQPAAPPSLREAPPAPETAAAPVAAPRVVLHYREGAGAEADRLATALAGRGPRFTHVETRLVAGTPRQAMVRFFHPEDVAAAWELQAALSATGDDWQVRNYTRYQPKPRRGTLEVWLP